MAATCWAGRSLLRIARSAPIFCGELLVQLDPAGVRRDDNQILEPEIGEVLGEHEQRGHVVARLLKETLDLAGVQVHGEDPVDPGRLEHARHQSRADRLPRR